MEINKYSVAYEKPGRNLALIRDCVVHYDAHLNCAENIFEMMCDIFHADIMLDEHIWIIGLDNKLNCSGVFEVSHGEKTRSLVPVREIMRDLLMIDAISFSMVHNHPSGDITPSHDDCETTTRLKEVSSIIGITFVDHIIIGDGVFYSFKSDGYKLWRKTHRLACGMKAAFLYKFSRS